MPRLSALMGGLLFLTMGCVHWHLEQNAPGHVDVGEPPAVLECEAQERPRDPGENVIALFPTVFLGGGVVGLTSKQGQGATAIGAEVSVLYGSFERSHGWDELFIRPPQGGIGFNAGVYAFSRTDNLMAYGELLFRPSRLSLLNISPGWAWNTTSSHHGPQLTLSSMLLYLRATHLLGAHTDVSAGIYLDAALAWFWSR